MAVSLNVIIIFRYDLILHKFWILLDLTFSNLNFMIKMNTILIGTQMFILTKLKKSCYFSLAFQVLISNYYLFTENANH